MQTMMANSCRVLVVSSALCSRWRTPTETDAPPAAAATATPARRRPPGISDAQRKNLLLANIPLGKDEGDGFWPLFRDYRRDMSKLQDQRAKAVAEYAETFRTMTGDQAKAIVESFLHGR